MRVSGLVVTLVVALATLTGLAAGVALYAWLDREQPGQSLQQRTSISESMRQPVTVSSTVAQERLPNDIDSSLHSHSVLDTTKYSTDFAQSASLYLLLAQAEVDDLNSFIDESFSISPRNQRIAALSIIFGRFASIDPDEALARALELKPLTSDERSNLVRSIFNEWTVGNLNAAAAAIRNLPQEYKLSAAEAVIWRSDFLPTDKRIQLARQFGLSEAWITGTVASIRSDASKDDPKRSFYDHIRDTTETPERNIELADIAEHWFEIEGAEVLSEIHESLDNRHTRNFIIRNLIWRGIGTEAATPTSILNVVTGFSNQQDAKQAVEVAFRAWSRFDPKESFETSLEFSDQFVSHDLRSSLLQFWASTDAEGLLDEASSLPRTFRNTAIIEALGRISHDTPATAIQYARNLDTYGLRRQASEEIIREWSAVDAKSAFEWLMNDSFNDDARSEYSIWRRAFSSYLDQDFNSAERYAEKYQGELKNQFIEAVARHLVESDLERAIEYVPRVRESMRWSIHFDIGQEMAKARPIEALAYGENLHKERHDQYYGRLLSRWARRDFFSLHENIHRVPSAYQGHAARALLHVNGSTDYLSAPQVRALETIVAAHPIVPSGE